MPVSSGERRGTFREPSHAKARRREGDWVFRLATGDVSREGAKVRRTPGGFMRATRDRLTRRCEGRRRQDDRCFLVRLVTVSRKVGKARRRQRMDRKTRPAKLACYPASRRCSCLSCLSWFGYVPSARHDHLHAWEQAGGQSEVLEMAARTEGASDGRPRPLRQVAAPLG